MADNNVFKKDPDATLDFGFDWTEWLSEGELISSASVTISASSLTKLSESFTSTGSVIVWVSGGTSGSRYSLTCQITSSDNRIDQRTMKIDVQDR